MSRLRRLVLLRHGETDGQSSIRFHGKTDVALSKEGLAQAHTARHALCQEVFDRVVSSPLQRAWASALIVTAGAPVELESNFREVDFGRWEGLTAEEIRARDPALYERWQAKEPDFEYPGGEMRAHFQARVLAGLARIEHSPSDRVLVVTHKGVIRTIALQLLGAPIDEARLSLGGSVTFTRAPDGGYRLLR